jgi:DtxR family Mn-dependent transcriptional regulator
MTDDGRSTTESEEMYLITVARAIEDGGEPPIAVSTIAQQLGVSSVSANQMIKKLEAESLVSYVPYRGVDLTDEGERLANVVLRSRRLWGVFLVEHLGLTAKRADEVACEMEHVTPEEVADRLSEFLGAPSIGPQGKAIPSGGGQTDRQTTPLSDVNVGDTVVVVGASEPFDGFLASQAIDAGTDVAVVAAATDGAMVIQGPTGAVQLSADAAAAIAVEPG